MNKFKIILYVFVVSGLIVNFIGVSKESRADITDSCNLTIEIFKNLNYSGTVKSSLDGKSFIIKNYNYGDWSGNALMSDYCLGGSVKLTVTQTFSNSSGSTNPPSNATIFPLQKVTSNKISFNLGSASKAKYTYQLEYYDNFATFPSKSVKLEGLFYDPVSEPNGPGGNNLPDPNPNPNPGENPPTNTPTKPPIIDNKNYTYDGTFFDKSIGSLTPLTQYQTVPELLIRVAKVLFVLLGSFAVLVLMYGGFMMVTSQGKQEQLATAKRTITWAIIGVITALLSYSIVAILQTVLGIF